MEEEASRRRRATTSAAVGGQCRFDGRRADTVRRRNEDAMLSLSRILACLKCRDAVAAADTTPTPPPLCVARVCRVSAAADDETAPPLLLFGRRRRRSFPAAAVALRAAARVGVALTRRFTWPLLDAAPADVDAACRHLASASVAVEPQPLRAAAATFCVAAWSSAAAAGRPAMEPPTPPTPPTAAAVAHSVAPFFVFFSFLADRKLRNGGS